MPAAPPKQRVFLSLGHKAVERLGRKQLWRIPRALRRQPSPLSLDDARECLRDLGVFIADEDYAVLADTYAPRGSSDACDLDALLKDGSSAILGFRRGHVVELVLRKLDPDRTGLVAGSRVDSCYDVQRHPMVLGGHADADDVVADFFDTFRDEADADAGGDTFLTCEELLYYYCGLSLSTAKDEEFELRCVRSFSLDRPRLNTEDEAARMAGSRAVSRQSRMLGEGRDHPLYTTTNREYGSTAKDAAPAATSFGRSQRFTREQPPRSGGATSMNM